MDERGLSLLDLPPLRGNPFDSRPIEPSRAHDLVGRDFLMARWRDHIHSQSPRMIFLVGESGSGRTSIINSLTTQTTQNFISQYWPGGEDPVKSILQEMMIHFGGFEIPRAMNQLSQQLITSLDDMTGPLPLIALDYPSNIDLSEFLARITPVLSRLRAFVVVSLTESQLSRIDQDVVDCFDEPERLKGLSHSEIQSMSDNRTRLKSREKWRINPQLLDAIHSRTGGNPREVIRLLRNLVDERRELGAEGTLAQLMAWSAPKRAEPQFGAEPQYDSEITLEGYTEPAESVISWGEDEIIHREEEHDNDIKIEDNSVESDDLFDEEPDDLWVDDEEEVEEEVNDWDSDFVVEEPDWRDESEGKEQISDGYDEEERIAIIESQQDDDFAQEKITTYVPEPQTELEMEPGTEPPPRYFGGGSFGGLRSRLAKTTNEMSDEPDETEIMYADRGRPTRVTPLDTPAAKHAARIDAGETIRNQGAPSDAEVNPNTAQENAYVEARVDHSISKMDEEHVMSGDGAEWFVDPSLRSTLPDLTRREESTISPPSVFDAFEAEESTPQIEFADEEIIEIEPLLPPIPTPQVTPIAPLQGIPPSPPPAPSASTPSPLPRSNFGPRWEPDSPFDEHRFYSLSDAERIILDAAASREISPSDAELQARLEVGRPRLSQIYNGLHKAGMLSVRKQGRTRLFKLSESAANAF